MNKFEFISHLLENQKMNSVQKERFLKLASKEIGLVKPSNEELWDEIQKIKEQLKIPYKGSEITTVIDTNGNSIDLKKPQGFERIDVKKLLGDTSQDTIEGHQNILLTPDDLPFGGDDGIIVCDREHEKAEIVNHAINVPDKGSNKDLSNKKKLHNPKKVNEWLQYFTVNNTAIKFSTHPWDDDLYNSYEDYIDALTDEYKKYDFYNLQNYSADLYWNKIYPFLFQSKLTKVEVSGKKLFGWGRYKIGIGWKYPNHIKSFCENNFDDKGIMASTPQTMELPPELLPDIPGKTIKTFEDVINVFKQEIEFRDNRFLIGVKTALKRSLPKHSVDETILNSLKGCSFYTNTEYVLKAISRMFNMIKSRSESQNVNISCSLDRDNSLYVLEILHLNSYSDMHIHHPKLFAEKTGDLSILRTTLLSLCDFSIESRFKDDKGKSINARIEYLFEDLDTTNWEPNIINDIEDPGGFKFVLKFLV
jgi:hypothetical protein